MNRDSDQRRQYDLLKADWAIKADKDPQGNDIEAGMALAFAICAGQLARTMAGESIYGFTPDPKKGLTEARP